MPDGKLGDQFMDQMLNDVLGLNVDGLRQLVARAKKIMDDEDLEHLRLRFDVLSKEIAE